MASEFSQAIIRLNSNMPNTALSGTICTTPSSAGAGIENTVLINFPSDFSINTNATNFTIDTSNLPDGSIPWPGISSNALNITNNSVTLSSGDLTDGSELYCFSFTANESTTGTIGNKSGNLTTKNSSNVTVDSSDFGLSIIANDQIKVTAKVPGAPDDFTISLNKLTDGDKFYPGNVIDYEISYGSLIVVPYPITIEASWTQGTVAGDTTPTLNLVDYESGSATNAYGSTIPIIDIQNRRIVWTIKSFPANLTNQKVYFKLRANSDYSLSVNSSFTVKARIILPLTSTSFKNITSSIYPKPVEIVPQEIKIPEITRVSMNSITANEATVFIQTNDLTKVTTIYGTDIKSLPKISGTLRNSTEHLVKFKDLEADTIYYFKIFVKDTAGTQIASDIYTFRTAKESAPLTANPESLVATSDNTIISTLIPDDNNYLVIPTDTVFQFKFAMKERLSANSIQGLMRNENVLGIFTYITTAEANTESVNLIETLNGIYSGNLKTKPTSGNFDLIAKIYDRNGNLVEQKLAKVKVIDKFKVISKNNNPIEGARVFLYVYSPSSRRYDVIPSSVLAKGNPLFTNSNGELDLVLPQGRYKAEVTDLRHEEKSVEFEIGPEKGQEFPVVVLENAKITPLSLFNYYKRSINDVFLKNTRVYSETLTGSSRFFDLTALLSLAVLVIITLVAFSRRHHVPLLHIPSYFYYLLDRSDKNEKYIHGVIYDENDLPIKSANVYLMDKADEKIISHKKSNKYGEFFFKKGKSQYLIMAMAKGYSTSPVFEYQEKAHLKFKIMLKKEEEGLHLIGRLFNYLSLVTGLGFEVLLILSLILELLFLNSFGVAKTLPFLAITILNLILWMLHLRSKNQIKVSD